MRIAQIAPLHERVPPYLYGGMERIVFALTEELASASATTSASRRRCCGCPGSAPSTTASASSTFPFGSIRMTRRTCCYWAVSHRGTPVTALRGGSVVEVMDDGVTGHVCDTFDTMVEAIGRIDRLDRAACRAHAETHFTSRLMTSRYERIYERVISGSGVCDDDSRLADRRVEAALTRLG